MKKHFKYLLVFSMTLTFSCSAIEQPTPPNVIVILLDDAGYVDFGFMGCEDLETPHIDRLAGEGIVFTDGHVSATVCSPSRAGIMSGRYQQRFGFENNGTGNGLGLDTAVYTMADAFKSSGYATYALGKWHLGDRPQYHPNKRGFDEFYGFLTGSRSYFPLKNPTKARMLQHNGERVEFEGYMTDVLGEQAVKYIEENAGSPFFMYFAPNAVHTPMHAKEELLKKYADHPRKELAAMTWSIDENIGKMVDKLKEKGIYENTIIFFLSDNGGAHNNQSDMGPLKGWKGNKFEGGHRVPFFMSWPKEMEGGKTYNELVTSLDIFATSAAVAGFKEKYTEELDGSDLVPFIKGEKEGAPNERFFWRKDEMAAARIGNHKLIRLENYGTTLYDLDSDLGETNDLTRSDTLKSEELKKALTSWEEGLMEPLWYEGKDWVEVTYHIHQFLMENKEALYKSPGARRRYEQEMKGEDE